MSKPNRGGKREGAGRKPLLDPDDRAMIGAYCEDLWIEEGMRRYQDWERSSNPEASSTRQAYEDAAKEHADLHRSTKWRSNEHDRVGLPDDSAAMFPRPPHLVVASVDWPLPTNDGSDVRIYKIRRRPTPEEHAAHELAFADRERRRVEVAGRPVEEQITVQHRKVQSAIRKAVAASRGGHWSDPESQRPVISAYRRPRTFELEVIQQALQRFNPILGGLLTERMIRSCWDDHRAKLRREAEL